MGPTMKQLLSIDPQTANMRMKSLKFKFVRLLNETVTKFRWNIIFQSEKEVL